MKTLTISEVIQATQGKYSGIAYDIMIKGVSTDSRKTCEDALFVPIEGPNFDGHDFIGQALAKGAAASLCQETKRAKVDALPVDRIILWMTLSMHCLSLLHITGAFFGTFCCRNW